MPRIVSLVVLLVGLLQGCARLGFEYIDDELVSCWPQCSGDDAAHPFPFGFDDAQFFANVTPSAPLTLSCGTVADLSITEPQEPASIMHDCDVGTITIERTRVGGDGAAAIPEAFRCGGSGTINIVGSWLEAGDGDVMQCFDPNNSPTATINISNSTIRAHDMGSAGIFVADAYALDLRLSHVMFWGGPFGLRFHTDGRPGTLSMNDVCFYGLGPDNNSFTYGPYLIDPTPPTILAWHSVNWCTIEDGALVVHGAIPPP